MKKRLSTVLKTLPGSMGVWGCKVVVDLGVPQLFYITIICVLYTSLAP